MRDPLLSCTPLFNMEHNKHGYSHVPILVWTNCRKESVMRKVTVRLNSHDDENDRSGHARHAGW